MKNLVLKVSNLVLYLVGSAMVATGLLLAYRLPPGSRGGRGLTLFGWDRHQWGDLHLYLGFALIGLTILHLFLNRKWLQKIAAGRRAWKLAAGLVAGLLLILFLMIAPVQKATRGGENENSEGRHRAQRGASR